MVSHMAKYIFAKQYSQEGEHKLLVLRHCPMTLDNGVNGPLTHYTNGESLFSSSQLYCR